jgi:hypothetical protein
MRDRFRGQEVYERMGMPVDECLEYTDNSVIYKTYQSLLFSRIVPCVRDIGLWGPKVQKAYADMGVLDAAKADLSELMRRDEEIAEEYDRELAARKAEVRAAIANGAAE